MSIIVVALLGTSASAEEALPLQVALPAGVRELGRAFDPADARVDLFLDWHGAVDELVIEDIVRAALADELDAGRLVSGVIPWVVQDGEWVPLPALLPALPPVPAKAWESEASTTPPSWGRRRQGALSGKHIYVSAGHGWAWTPTLDRWATQRGNTHDLVEDFISAETINQLMVTGLENAGATVWTVRERDMNEHMVIVDEADATTTGTWTTSTAAGFGGHTPPYLGNVNVFADGATQVAAASVDATASMTWSAAIAGDYGVYVSWSASGNRVSDAHYVVRHAGGESDFRVDQTRHGATWFHLGRFHFDGAAEVVLMNDTLGDAADKYVAADAVRFGGGMGDFARGAGEIATPEVSGHPRWEECSRYHIQFTGAPTSVYAYTADERSSDVGARSRYAAWQHEAGEDAIYVAWHTNAPDPGRGTSTFVYGPNAPDGSYQFTGVAGSDELAEAIHDTLIADIRERFDASWRDRGISSAYFGEINPSHNGEMPSTLIEVAFHSTEADAAYLREPAFRAVAARAYVRGIIRYFAERDGDPAVLPPERPLQVKVVGVASDTIRVSWMPPEDDGGDPATGYRVYVSDDGRGFDDGTDVTGTSVELDAAPGVVTYVKVTATNAGGESFASPVLAALTGCEPAEAAIVMGFYRLDAASYPRDDLSAWGLATIMRGLLWKVNRFDYVIEHAEALAAANVAFDSMEAGGALDGYRFVDWLLGEESVADETLSKDEQALITAWLGPTRGLLLSGSELAWDLGARGDAGDQAFLGSLGVGFGGDDAATYMIDGGLLIDDGARGTYDVDYPDVLTPTGDAEVILRYAGGAVAGTRATASGAVAIVLGVPLEALSPAAMRNQKVADWVAPLSLGRVAECGSTPDPEPEPELEVSEPEPEPEPEPELATSSPEAGRPRREAHSLAFTPDDGCAGGDPSALWLVLFVMASIGKRASVSRRRDG